MRKFQDTFEIRRRSFISAFSICMTVPLIKNTLVSFDDDTENILLSSPISEHIYL